MSQQNVEIVRASIEALNRRDPEAALKDAAPELEFDFSRSVGPNRGVYALAEVGRLFERFLEPWDSVHWEAAEFRAAGDRVLTQMTTHHRGRDGIETQARATWVWTIRQGTIVRIAYYEEREEALADMPSS